MSDSNQQDATQQLLMRLNSDCTVLKELQSRTENQVSELVDRTNKLQTGHLVFQEHFRAYSQTVVDIQTKVAELMEVVTDLKSTVKELNSNKEKCPDRFKELNEQIKRLNHKVIDINSTLITQSSKLERFRSDMDTISTLVEKLATVHSAGKTIVDFLKRTWLVIASAVAIALTILTIAEKLGK